MSERADRVPDALQRRSATRLSDAYIQVDDDGSLWLELHASRTVGDDDIAALTALGATVTARTGTVVAAWVAHDRIDAAAALPWVVAVRPVELTAPDDH